MIFLCLLTGCSGNYTGKTGVYKSLDDLAGKKIGVMTGSVHDSLVEKRLPSAQIVYFTAATDLPAALTFIVKRIELLIISSYDSHRLWITICFCSKTLSCHFLLLLSLIPSSGSFRKESSRVLMPKIITFNGYAGMPPSVFMANRTCAAVPRLSASSSRSNSGE